MTNLELKNPNFIVIGAQKGGTTALFSQLAEHPQIYMPPQKEVQFFSNNELFSNGISWYLAEFFSSKNDKIAGEISPQYMFYKKVPFRINEQIPATKLIVILRNPIDRAYSHYRMSVRRGQEKATFIDSIKKQIEKGILPDEDIVESLSYYQFSCYSHILSDYLTLFPSDQLLLLFQEDLKSRPLSVLKKVFSFIGVDEEYIPKNPDKRVHQSGVKRFPRLENFLNSQNPLKKILKPFVSGKNRAAWRFWVEQFNVKPLADSGPTDEEREYLAEIFVKEPSFIFNNFSVKAPWVDWD